MTRSHRHSRFPAGPKTAPLSRDVPLREKRRQKLTQLLTLWPGEIEDSSYEGQLRIVKKLEQQLRAERRRGKAGHWTYNLTHHLQLARAFRDETRRLRQMKARAS